MKPPINVIKITPIRLKSKQDSFQILIDRKDFLDHLIDAKKEIDNQAAWSGKKSIVIKKTPLVDSSVASGKYEILDCTCESGAYCAGMDLAIKVTHDGDFITWKYTAPETFWKENETKVFSFTFHKPQYLKEIDKISK